MQTIRQVLLIGIVLGISMLESVNCGSINIKNVYVSWTSTVDSTDFVVTSPLGNGVGLTGSWLAIGFNSNCKMNGTNTVLCKNLASSSGVYTYLNSAASTSLFDPKNPQLGLSNASVSVKQGNLTCSFTRSNVNQQGYIPIDKTTQSYLLVAYGNATDSAINSHGKLNKGCSQSQVNFAN